MPSPTTDEIIGLDMFLRGQVVVPGSIMYESEAKKMHNGMLHNNKPLMYVLCKDIADVQATLSFVQKHDLPLSIRSGGHAVCGSSIRNGSVVLDVGKIDHATYNGSDNTLTVGPGATLSDVNVHLLRHGRMAPVGVAPPTGCGGLITQGGIGWLLNRFGTSVDNITGLTIVLADGTIKNLSHASTGEDRELYFASRGAASLIGVVTSITIRTYPLEEMVGGMWAMVDDTKYSKSRALMKLLRDIVLQQEENDERNLFGGVYMGNVPPEDMLPEDVRGKPCTLVVMGCWGTDVEAQEIVNKFVDREVAFGTSPKPMPFNVFNQIFSGMFLKWPQMGTYWKAPMTNTALDQDIDAFCDKWADHEPWLNAGFCGIEAQGGKAGRRYGAKLNEGNENCVPNLRSFLFAMPAFAYYPPENEYFNRARTIARDMGSIFEEQRVASYSNVIMDLESKNDGKREADLCFSGADRIQAIKKIVDPNNIFQRKVIAVAETDGTSANVLNKGDKAVDKSRRAETIQQ